MVPGAARRIRTITHTLPLTPDADSVAAFLQAFQDLADALIYVKSHASCYVVMRQAGDLAVNQVGG